MARVSSITRTTKETDISLKIDLDGRGEYKVETGIPFLNHMLELFSKHSLIDFELKAKGDLQVDGHHTVEDIGIVLGSAVKEALGEKENIMRYGWAAVPMDECLALAALDLSGRSFLSYDIDLPKEEIGKLDTALINEFFQAFTDKAECTLHLRLLTGKNTHHMVEATFKAFAKALMAAVAFNERTGIPSTKGKL